MVEDLSFGALLRRLRLAADLTLDQLAARAGVSDRTLSSLERGVGVRPRAGTVQAVADGLNATPADREALLAAARSVGEAKPPVNRLPAPRQVADFTGRADELAQVQQHVAGGGSTVVISGEAGVGKTTFAVRVAQAWPVEERFFVDLRGLDPQPSAAVAVLGRLIRAVDPSVRTAPPDAAEAAALWQSLAGDRRMVVVLDDAADETQVRPLLARGRAVSLVTSRRAMSDLGDPLRLRLSPLRTADSVALLAGMLARTGHAPSAEDLGRIADLCTHLPLALRIAGNRLVSRPGWSAGDLIGRLAPPGRRLDTLSSGDLRIRAAFDLSYRQLAGPPARLFRRLALVPGSPIDPALAGALLPETPVAAATALGELAGLSLLRERSDGRYELPDLLRLFAAEKLELEESAPDRSAAARAVEDYLTQYK